MTCLWELSAIATAACEASDVSLHVVMDRHVCASENGMLSDLSVTWEGFLPSPSRFRSTNIADFVANPK
jgi:predicted HD phosphohydrolase